MLAISMMFAYFIDLGTTSSFLLILKDRKMEDHIEQNFWSDISIEWRETLSLLYASLYRIVNETK